MIHHLLLLARTGSGTWLSIINVIIINAFANQLLWIRSWFCTFQKLLLLWLRLVVQIRSRGKKNISHIEFLRSFRFLMVLINRTVAVFREESSWRYFWVCTRGNHVTRVLPLWEYNQWQDGVTEQIYCYTTKCCKNSSYSTACCSWSGQFCYLLIKNDIIIYM